MKKLDTVNARSARLGVILALAGMLAMPAAIAQMKVNLSLSGGAEVPPVKTAASGSGEFWVAADHTLSGKFSVTGMNATAAHIHEGAMGSDGPVIIRLVKGSDGSFSVPPGTKLTDAQYAAFQAGKLYVNVHSEAHPSGEIRAQLSAGGAPASSMGSGY